MVGRLPRSDAVIEALTSHRSKGTENNYGTGWRTFTAYCDQRGIRPFTATPLDICDYLAYLSERGTNNMHHLQPYLSAINAAFKDLGHVDGPAKGPLVNAVRDHYKARQVDDAPTDRVYYLPAPVAKQIYDAAVVVVQAQDFPADDNVFDLATALLVTLVTYVTGSRPSSIRLLKTTDVKFLQGHCLQITRDYVKGQNDNDLQDVTGRHPVSFPHSNYHSLYDILHTFHTHLSSQAADREYFFSISQPCASANNAWLLTALSHVQATPPAGFRFVPKSCRRGFASGCFAAGVARERINYVGGWSFNSETALKNYADLSAPCDEETKFFFSGWRTDV